MSFATKIAEYRLNYHATLVDLGNAFNQLRLMNDEKAEEFCKKHTMLALEAGARMHGMTLEQALKEMEDREL